MQPIPSAQAERKPEENEISKSCEHCGQQFEPRSGSGGKPQRFCSTECRLAFHGKPQRSQRTPTYRAPPQLPAVIPQPKPENAPADSPEAKDFDWNTNDASIILREQPATAIYFNKEGSLVIRQHRWPDHDAFIYIADASINDFLDKLTDICGVPSVGKPR
jgi:MYM-type Zinc finger with FCS sequence motif